LKKAYKEGGINNAGKKVKYAARLKNLRIRGCLRTTKP